MFELYTEQARRVIFFARYAASQYGGRSIETEHLLLALLQEHGRSSRCLSPLVTDASRKEIEGEIPRHPKLSTQIDLPLSAQCKRILGYANDEGRTQITPGHILVGILREPSCFAFRLLEKYGVTLEAAREEVDSKSHHVPQGQQRFVMLGSSSPELSRLLADAAQKAREFGHAQALPGHVLLSFLNDEGSEAGQFLARHGITSEKVRRELLHGS